MGRDKFLHFLAGFGIAVSAATFTTPTVGFCIAGAVGIAKELVWDRLLGRGTPEILDAVWTFVGAGLGAWLMTLG